MLTEILAWGTVGAIYAFAFGALALPKHWYRTAQVLFLVATTVACAKVLWWSLTSTRPESWRVSFGLAGLLAFIGAAFWFTRKVQADIREEQNAEANLNSTDLAKRDHVVGRLRDFIREANEPRLDSPFFSRVGLRFGLGGRIEEFLSMYSTEWIERLNKKGVSALDEISAELLNGAPVPPLLGPSSGQAQAKFVIEVMKAIASPLIGPDHIAVGSQLFFHLHILRTGTSSNIQTFGVDIITEQTKYTVEQPEGGKLNYPLGGQEIQNLYEEIKWELFQHGQGREGYLLFHLEDTPSPGDLSKTIPKCLKGALAEVWIKDRSGRKDHSKGVEIETFEQGQTLDH
jgi:hypothetical protein